MLDPVLRKLLNDGIPLLGGIYYEHKIEISKQFETFFQKGNASTSASTSNLLTIVLPYAQRNCIRVGFHYADADDICKDGLKQYLYMQLSSGPTLKLYTSVSADPTFSYDYGRQYGSDISLKGDARKWANVPDSHKMVLLLVLPHLLFQESVFQRSPTMKNTHDVHRLTDYRKQVERILKTWSLWGNAADWVEKYKKHRIVHRINPPDYDRAASRVVQMPNIAKVIGPREPPHLPLNSHHRHV